MGKAPLADRSRQGQTARQSEGVSGIPSPRRQKDAGAQSGPTSRTQASSHLFRQIQNLGGSPQANPHSPGQNALNNVRYSSGNSTSRVRGREWRYDSIESQAR